MIVDLLIIFMLNIVASAMKVLNTMFISKKIMKPVYITTFIDACVFSYGLKMISEGDNLLFILVFALGKVLGAYLANVLEEKMAIGLLEVSLYANGRKALKLADTLRELGFSVTTLKGYGINGNTRFMLDIALERKDLPLLKEVLAKYGFDEATMVIRDINSVSGKFKTNNIENEDKLYL